MLVTKCIYLRKILGQEWKCKINLGLKNDTVKFDEFVSQSLEDFSFSKKDINERPCE